MAMKWRSSRVLYTVPYEALCGVLFPFFAPAWSWAPGSWPTRTP